MVHKLLSCNGSDWSISIKGYGVDVLVAKKHLPFRLDENPMELINPKPFNEE